MISASSEKLGFVCGLERASSIQTYEKHEKLKIRLQNYRNAKETQKSRDIKQLTRLL